MDRTLDAVGLQRAQVQPAAFAGPSGSAAGTLAAPGSRIALRLHAGPLLNADTRGQSLSVVVRIFELRDKEAFLRAPYEDFQKAVDASGFSRDVVRMREVVLTPGKAYEALEAVAADAPFVAVAALFRAPAAQRWRFVFETRAASRTGITLGAHGCALSVSAGNPIDTAPETLRLAGAVCP